MDAKGGSRGSLGNNGRGTRASIDLERTKGKGHSEASVDNTVCT